MSQRDNTVRIRKQDKKQLDEIAKQEYGTTEVPYGVVLETLIDRAENNLIAA